MSKPDLNNLPMAPGPIQDKLEADFERALETRRLSQEYEKEWKDLRDVKVIPMVKQYGAHQKDDLPDDSVIRIGPYKVQWQGKSGRTFKNEAALLVLLTEKYPKLKTRITKMREVLDVDAYAALLAEGNIPDKVRAVYEQKGDPSYEFHYWLVAAQLCSKCDGEVNKADKFCKHCGAPVTLDVARAPKGKAK